MIVFSVNKAMRDCIVAALRIHHDDHRMLGGLTAKIKREEIPAALAGLFDIWPADQDGAYRVALSDVGGTLVWRAYAIAEIAAGRGTLATLDKHSKRFGVVRFDPAFAYICDQMRGRGVRPCSDADRDCWADTTSWVVNDGFAGEPRKRWARSTWARRANTHEAYAVAGLAKRGCSTWYPEATLLFVTPRPEPALVHAVLSPEDDAAMANLAASR